MNYKDAIPAGHTYLFLGHGVAPPNFASTLGQLLEVLRCARVGLRFDERGIEKEVGAGCTLWRLEMFRYAD